VDLSKSGRANLKEKENVYASTAKNDHFGKEWEGGKERGAQSLGVAPMSARALK